LSRIHFLTGLLALGLAVGCKAQPAAQASQDLALNRRIEVMVRSQFNVPPDYGVALGARTPSQIPGYDALPVTLTRGARNRVIDFLISTDGKTLARLDKFDLANDPFLCRTGGAPPKPAKPGLDNPLPRLAQAGATRCGVPDFCPPPDFTVARRWEAVDAGNMPALPGAIRLSITRGRIRCQAFKPDAKKRRLSARALQSASRGLVDTDFQKRAG